MAITIDSLKFKASERMTDNSDGGGMMGATEIVSGVENSVFDDVSDVDRATGDISIRKVYASVASADNDKYLDASIGIFRAPADSDVTVIGFSTGDFYDEREDISEQVEQYRSHGIDTMLRLIGTHAINQRLVYGYILSPVNYDINAKFYDQIISLSNGTNEQYVRVMRVRYNNATYLYMDGTTPTPFAVVEVSLDITTPLKYVFAGSALSPNVLYEPPSTVYTTQTVPPLVFFGLQPLTAQATTGATAVTVADTKVQMVPVEYQDFGETQAINISGDIIYPQAPIATLSTVLDAPDGFSVDLPAQPNAVSRIAYLYGGEWIETGEPNAASYYASTGVISFPLRPDSGSKVYVAWPESRNYATEQLSVSEGITVSVVASSTAILNRGRLGFSTQVSTTTGTMDLYGVDDGIGGISGQIEGTINYTTGAITLTGSGQYSGFELALSGWVRVYYQTTPVSPFTALALLSAAPIIASTLTVTAYAATDGALITGTDNGLGVVAGTGISGTVDYVTGLITLAYTASVVHNSVTASYRLGGIFPQSAEILGIDSIRLPKDGRVPIYADNQLVLIHHTDKFNESSLSASQVLDCGRLRLYRAVIDGANGVRLSPEQYTLNRELGTLTMKPTLDLTGVTAPYTISHTIGDLCRINRVSAGNNQLVLARPVSHTFPADESMVSSLLYVGTLQARITQLFVQSTWTSVWSDALIGSEPLAQFNDAQYPIALTNAGAYPDRIFSLRCCFVVGGCFLHCLNGSVHQNKHSGSHRCVLP